MVVDGSPRPAENSAESSPSQHGQGISTVRDSCVHVRCRPIVFCCVLRLAAVRVSLVSRGAGVKTLKDLSSDEVTGHTPTLLSRSGLWCYKPVVYKQQHQDFQTKFLVFFSLPMQTTRPKVVTFWRRVDLATPADTFIKCIIHGTRVNKFAAISMRRQ